MAALKILGIVMLCILMFAILFITAMAGAVLLLLHKADETNEEINEELDNNQTY